MFNVAGLRSTNLLKWDSNTGVFLESLLRKPILKNIYEDLLPRVSSWNFATTKTFMNKNNYIFVNIKKKTVVSWLWKYKFYTEFLFVNFFKKIVAHDLITRSNFYQLLRIRPLLKTSVVRSIFSFSSICQLFLCKHLFYIVVCYSVTLHTTS